MRRDVGQERLDGPAFERVDGEFVVRRDEDEKTPTRGPPRDLDAGKTRHVDVQKGNVRTFVVDEPERSLSVPGLSGDLEPRPEFG